MKEKLALSTLPPITGQVFGGLYLILQINSVEYLTDIYINKNMFMTKHPDVIYTWSKTMRRSILFA